jgi:hypothetical protein
MACGIRRDFAWSAGCRNPGSEGEMSANEAVETARSRTGIDPVIAGIVAFFLVHMLIRIFGSSNFSVDDTEATVHTQVFRLYYMLRNPPLFDWLYFG